MCSKPAQQKADDRWDSPSLIIVFVVAITCGGWVGYMFVKQFCQLLTACDYTPEQREVLIDSIATSASLAVIILSAAALVGGLLIARLYAYYAVEASQRANTDEPADTIAS